MLPVDSITMWILILNYYQYHLSWCYQIVPLDPVPDCRLEMGIELIYPQSLMSMPEPQKEETLQIIYQRVAFEISNPEKSIGLFQIDGRMYHLVRIPYTGVSQDFGGGNELTFWDLWLSLL